MTLESFMPVAKSARTSQVLQHSAMTIDRPDAVVHAIWDLLGRATVTLTDMDWARVTAASII